MRTPSLAIAAMRCAGDIVGTVLQELADRVEPGWTTAAIDSYAEARVRALGALPSFKGLYGFPASTCVCLNEEAVHGIPQRDRVIEVGDLVSIDLGACWQGWHGDACITLGMPSLSAEARHLMQVAAEALVRGIAVVRAGVPVQVIAAVIEDYVTSEGLRVLPQFVGHGIGRQLHAEPQVPHCRDLGLPNPYLRTGQAITIEPVVVAGEIAVKTLEDGWTVITRDRGWSAQYEHTLWVTETGCEVLTQSPKL